MTSALDLDTAARTVWREIPDIYGYEVSEVGVVRRSKPGKRTWPVGSQIGELWAS